MTREYLTLTQAAKKVPGRPHVSTLWRWCRQGIEARNGVRIRLNHQRVGRRLFTTEDDLHEFFTKVSEADVIFFENTDTGSPPNIPQSRSKRDRERAMHAAEERLRQSGF